MQAAGSDMNQSNVWAAIPFPMALPPGERSGMHSDILQLGNEKTREQLEKTGISCIPHMPRVLGRPGLPHCYGTLLTMEMEPHPAPPDTALLESLHSPAHMPGTPAGSG